MKLSEIKTTVYRLTGTANTQQLKRLHPELCKGRNLRTKTAWTAILEALQPTQPVQNPRQHLESCFALDAVSVPPLSSDCQHLERCLEASPKGAKGRIQFLLDRAKRNLDAEIASLEKCREELKRYKKQ